MRHRSFFLLFAGFLSAVCAWAQTAPNRYILILEDPPAAAQFSSRDTLQSNAGVSYRRQVQNRQATLKSELATRNVRVTGSVDTLLNAVFVSAPASRLDELKALPGVLGVIPARRYTQSLNRATQLLNAPTAWNALGGSNNAGKGIKIAVLDSGIDQTHPAFQDSSLPMPSGFPICTGSDCAFTTNKVIVARSYVKQLSAGTDPSNPAADSRPDDTSPRDRGGHGTAVASCAAGNAVAGPTVAISGMAPKAYLGNYKIYGSPEVNDSTFDDVIIMALEDAVHDGMDIVSFSTGSPAFSGPLDIGATCGRPAGVPCDVSALAFENAAKAGMIIVVAAGNEGFDGFQNTPGYNTISSPASAPSVIAVGATTNSHVFTETVQVIGASAPSSLANITSGPDGSFVASGSLQAPMRDVSLLNNDGLACAALPAGSLSDTFALIKRGTCTFFAKMTNAATAGAIGVVFYMADGETGLASIGDLSSFGIPATMIANSDGVALKAFLAANADYPVVINPSGLEENATFNDLIFFSSLGPSTGDALLKPDVVAVGTDLYMATQSYDPLGELYSIDRFTSAAGTSFATPLTSGAAALVKQAHPNYSAAQVKSALVNFASQDVIQDDAGDLTDARFVGGGKVDAGAAVASSITITPSTLSFGALTTTSLPATRNLQIANSGSTSVNLTVSVSGPSSTATLAPDKTSLSIAAGSSANLTITLSGTVPGAGSYSGAVLIQGSGVTQRVPFLYLVSDNTAYNFIPLSGSGFSGTVGQQIPEGILSFKLVDQFGLAVAGAPITWTARGGAKVQNAFTVTDRYGIGAADAFLGTGAGNYSFSANVAGKTYSFKGTARPVPTITAVADGASFDATKPVAPGSYITITGSGLSDVTDLWNGIGNLPLAIDFVLVSFDAPSANISVPGHLIYVSPTQVNVQVPWELQGLTSAQVKVTIDVSNGNVVSVPLADYSPGLFGNGNVSARDLNFQSISTSNPAKRGATIQMYGNGLGPVLNQPKSGELALSSPLSRTTTVPVVTIGGKNANVSFSGLAPGFAGLYQINVVVPDTLVPGTYPVVVSIGGSSSPPSNLPVQ